MRNINPIYIVLGGIGLLIFMNNDRARLVANIVVLIVILIAGAQAFNVDLKFWK